MTSNVYIKVPEESITVEVRLSALAAKLRCTAAELVLLDGNFLN